MDLLQADMPHLEDLVSPRVMTRIKSECRWNRFPEGTFVHHRGDTNSGFSLIKNGRVTGSNVGLDGSTLTTSYLGPGECYGEFTVFAGLPRTHDIITVEDTEIGFIPEARFLALTDEEPEISKALLTIALRRSFGLLEFLDQLRRLPLDVRIARLILSRANTKQPDPTRIMCRQEDLAYTFGVSRVSVGSVLKQLKSLGFITTGYRHIEVTDISGLETWVQDRTLVNPLAVKQVSK